MRVGLLVLGIVTLAACGSKDMHLEPHEGDADGGQLVRLVGEDLLGHGPVLVYFGMRTARAVVVEDDRHIAVKTPEAEAFGPVDVRVEFSDGRVHELPQAFTYVQVGGKPLKPIQFRPGAVPVPSAAEP